MGQARQLDATAEESFARDETEGDAPSTTGNVVTIEQGRQRRDKGERKAPRPDKGERKAQRRSARATTGMPEDDAVEEERLADVDGALIEAVAENRTEVPPDATSVPESGQEVVETVSSTGEASAAQTKPGLVAPLIDASAGPKTLERAKVQYQQAEKAIASNPDVISVIAPLVRHVNGVTEQLNEVQINLGRVMAERDALREMLAKAQGVDVSEISVVPAGDGTTGGSEKSGRALHRIESRGDDASTQKAGRKLLKNPLGFDALATQEERNRIARRRQLLAIAIFGAIGLLIYINGRKGNDISSISRDSLADLQFVGVFFNMFFMAWMLYRVVRVGGKGAKWLFPDSQQQQRRR